MQDFFEKYQEIASIYKGSDYLQGCRDFFAQNAGQLKQEEKIDFLDYLSKRGGDAAFIVFCEEGNVLLELEQAKSYSLVICEKVQNTLRFSAYQTRMGDFFMKLPKFINSKDSEKFLQYAFELSIKYDCICALQQILLKDKENRFLESNLNKYDDLINKQSDRRIGENIRNYFQNGSICEDWHEAIKGYEYIPDVYIDYFATEGKEICNENLKSYKKSRLLSDKTTVEELNDFIDNQYNWDDGVEIPYFIMHHKNCDLALRKKLFELGAGDCIDEKTYIDTDKDPWKRFILELKDMIEKEEK